MQNIAQHLVHAHSGLRWIILLLLLLVLINSFFGMRSKGLFTKTDDRLSKYLVLSAHVMLLIGLFQYIFGTKGFAYIKASGMKEVMHTGTQRFYAVEHITMMILAIVLITMGRSIGKRKSTSAEMHKTIFWYTLIGFILIMISIPWPVHVPWQPEGLASKWF
jgi:hypothetical protein